MTTVAIQRLIDAAGALEPADRALLDLLLTRGLDNDSLARLSRVDAAAIVTRRERVVHRLSDELGLAPDQVRGALDEVGAATALAPISPAGPGFAQRRPVGKRLVNAAVALLGVAAVVVVLLVSPSSRHPRHPPVRRPTPAVTASAAPSPAAASPAPAASLAAAPAPAPSSTPTTTPAQPEPINDRAVPGAEPQRLVALPGVASQAAGWVGLAGTRRRPRLTLTITGLLAARGGHYEAWLYNSILDSTPLIRLRRAITSFSAPLPGDYRRFRSIDISFQPPGMVNDSGESVMRARIPGRAR